MNIASRVVCEFMRIAENQDVCNDSNIRKTRFAIIYNSSYLDFYNELILLKRRMIKVNYCNDRTCLKIFNTLDDGTDIEVDFWLFDIEDVYNKSIYLNGVELTGSFCTDKAHNDIKSILPERIGRYPSREMCAKGCDEAVFFQI